MYSLILTLLIALRAVESSNGLTAKNQLQITEICLQDVNRIYGTHYTMYDAYNLKQSREIAILYLSYWGPKVKKNPDYETLARIWNGGPDGNQKQSTIKYWHKVRKELLKNQKSRKIKK